MKRVCVFCGSSLGTSEAYRREAMNLGMLIAARDVELVYGGAVMGLMGILSNACIAAGGRVIGVVPENLVSLGVAKKNITELKVVKDMHERKSTMLELSDAFIAMPGGPGTLEEAFEIFSWMQLGIHRKPLAFLNVNGFYDGLMNFLGTMVGAGFLRREHRELIIVDDDAQRILDRLDGYSHQTFSKWEDMDKNRV